MIRIIMLWEISIGAITVLVILLSREGRGKRGERAMMILFSIFTTYYEGKRKDSIINSTHEMIILSQT